MGDTENKEQNVTSANSEELLIEIRNLTKKKLFWQKISTCCIAAITGIVLVTMVIVIPQLEATLNHINDTAIKAQDSLNEANTMITSITEASENFDSLVAKNGEGLTSAVESMSKIDFEGLNEAIKDLQDAIGPLAAFMSKFR
ncbi:hypothetical protein SAMN02910276_00871 [Butyrivibrio sp. Su6]|jgi:hypothetical protein|uniref:hypothetical protein n=1 Tax=Butyrivibrio sp. Su6 TaxID=1520810 RepID=UPI00089E1FAC|nr:hypothetical protein [Butyrivibrio sp. Su6]MBP3819188.1 hypothetical protein [Butyrivibrio sp.]MBQ6416771.1 hypothetical protein [Butyrivibrio sp.]SEF73338.1 hypothetical protein SAMN02910276_00871 [Butyrivibrio sp. Su6]